MPAATSDSAAPHVVFFDDRPVFLELFGDQREELGGHTVGVFVVAVPAQALYRDHLQRRPAERRVPLASGDLRARQNPARRFES